jgi:hypothetical protein
MTSISKSLLLLGIGVSIVFSCNNGPKVIEAETSSGEMIKPTGIFDLNGTSPSEKTPANQGSFTEDLHKVVVNEVIPASRYVYLNVTEAGNSFWIATRSQDITQGETYFYRGGLLKTNFESKEHRRTFDKIYLVSNLVPEKHGGNSGELGNTVNTPNNGETIQKELIPTHTEKAVQNKGQITIAELVAHPEVYEGKSVQLSGTCVKVNPNIMNRNWIHLKDGTQDDFDLVITSATFIPEGQKVTLKGIVNRNRDFGAGYTYALIVENATVVE